MVGPATEPLDTFTIALTEPLDLNHARPTNDSERLAFRNLRADLVTVDCQGDLRPGVVRSWTADSPETLTLTLEAPADTTSGISLSAAGVANRLAPGGEPQIPGMDSAVVLNVRQLRLFITASHDAVLRALGDPAVAVPDGLPFQGVQRATVLNMPGFPNGPALQFRLPPLGDPRDALDRGADLMVTREPALLEYAARRPGFAVHPLPWSRTYALIQMEQAPPLAAATTELERESLARDAVQVDARAAEPPFWWTESSCTAANLPAASPRSDRVVYLREDEVARALAERLVALAGPRERLTAAGLDHWQMTSALRQGSERAYVISLPKQPIQPCRDLAELPAGTRIRPLIDSRAHAIVRHGAPPLSVDWDGTVRVVRP
ncbi:MAG TPA: hypothetical protein VFH24_02025 [Gemmatimonadales bacterium]|nr:hypothetical protein [Gemmatimonadales bacterium]